MPCIAGKMHVPVHGNMPKGFALAYDKFAQDVVSDLSLATQLELGMADFIYLHGLFSLLSKVTSGAGLSILPIRITGLNELFHHCLSTCECYMCPLYTIDCLAN